MNRRQSLKVITLSAISSEILLPAIVTAQQTQHRTLKSKTGGWTAEIKDDGSISELQMTFNGEMISIPWRTDDNCGPSWEGVELHSTGKERYLFEGKKQHHPVGNNREWGRQYG